MNLKKNIGVKITLYNTRCLSVLFLQDSVNLTPTEYIKHHPGGMLGILRENEK